jgi:hypothetical protein
MSHICKTSLVLVLFHLSFGSCMAQVENFDTFLKNFSNNRDFQISRIDFPLKYVFLDDETFKLDSSLVSKKDYNVTKLHYSLFNCSEAYPMIYDNFKCELRDSDERVFRWKGFTGMDERYYFERKVGKWFLIKIENIGT